MNKKHPLAKTRVLCLVGEAYEDLELWYPKLRIEEASGHVTLAGPQQGYQYAGKHGYPCVSDAALGDMEADDFHGILIPGGWMPDSLRRDPKVLQLVRDFANHGKLVAAICHGPWILISAGVTKGRKMTAFWSIEADMRNSGANYQHKVPLVIDGHFITSPHYDNNGDFMKAIVEYLSKK